jgi:quercetin dioxygenase-like cupin family protein
MSDNPVRFRRTAPVPLDFAGGPAQSRANGETIMGLKGIAAASLALALAAGCSTEPAAPAHNEAAVAAPVPAPALPPPTQERFDRTMTGQPLARPPTPFQLLVTQAQFAPDHVIACHRHTWPRYVYLQQGNLRVTNYDAHRVDNFAAGDILVEAIGQWHEGLVTSREPVILAAFEQVPPGQSNSTPWTPPPPISPCTARPPR